MGVPGAKLVLLAAIEHAMLMVVGHQAKQQEKCKWLAVLELREVSEPEPVQAAISHDTQNANLRAVC